MIKQSYRFAEHSDKKYGEICRKINNLIIFYSEPRGTEDEANLILRNIWIGNWKSAYNYDFINRCRIEEIINATAYIPNKWKFIKYTTFDLHDKDGCTINLIDIINIGAEQIHKAVSSNKAILVHCKNGHHRSASIIALYLMKYHKMPLVDAIYFIKARRPTAFRRMTCLLQTLIYYEMQIMNS